MRYLNVPCVHCGKLFCEEDDVVACPTCGSPHHRDCWKAQDRCANAGLHTQGFVWKMPVTEKKEIEMTPPTPQQTVECPFCGAQNYANELYCSVCHEPIHRNASADAGEPLQDEQQREKMFADFQNFGGLDPNSDIDTISVKEYAAYLGKKPGSYIRRFMNMHTFSRVVSWNAPAFLLCAVAVFSSIVLGPVWFFYRKLNKIGVAFLAVLLVLGIGTAVVYTLDPAYIEYTEATKELYFDSLAQAQAGVGDVAQIMEELQVNLMHLSETFVENSAKLTNYWAFAVSAVQSYVFPVVAGIFANYFYFKKSKAEILSIREKHGQSPDYLQRLSRKGGTSVGGAVLGALLCFGIFLLQQYLPIILISLGLVK